ncbi:hypothetical protein CTEN210_07415 [Chaetoceros tenuissimus]|uniref:MYND-type domain-containing protein n=1 Tax=Chaetoceros tenuissimus TaxID=426638 RepID=A0AAD3CUQ5_9STRA|nr:hypothetical protein CTEN210_07415 [Chaetoceros tenuissimus]
MGKKSKRRNGKERSQKKAAAGQNKEAAITISNVALGSDETKKQQLVDDFDRAFEEFMLWSLSDRADLTPKKLKKIAPAIARMLLNGQTSTLNLILNKREKSINALEERRNEFELEVGIKLLMTRVNLGSDFDEALFLQEVEEIVKRQKHFMDPLDNIFHSFQEVAMKWTRSGYLCFKYCLFYNMIKSNFRNVFKNMMAKFVKSMEVSESKDGKLFQKFYSHSSAGQRNLKNDNLQKLLSSVLTLFQEMNTCWECKKIDGKALICAECKCATYCSRECQVKHWKEGKHRECCKNIGLLWSTYERRKKRVERAFYKDERVYTKPIKVNGLKKESFLRPCEWLDHYLCTCNGGKALASMDVFYKNLAKLVCGRKHVLFGNETISSQLEEKIRTSYEDVISEFDTKSLKKGELDAMKNISEKLMYPETRLANDELGISKDLSVDRFITLYICIKLSKRGNQAYNQFLIETELLQKLKSRHET